MLYDCGPKKTILARVHFKGITLKVKGPLGLKWRFGEQQSCTVSATESLKISAFQTQAIEMGFREELLHHHGHGIKAGCHA